MSAANVNPALRSGISSMLNLDPTWIVSHKIESGVIQKAMMNIQRSYSNRRLLFSRSPSKAAKLAEEKREKGRASLSTTDLTLSDDCDAIVEVAHPPEPKKASIKQRMTFLKNWLRSNPRKPSEADDSNKDVSNRDVPCSSVEMYRLSPFLKDGKFPKVADTNDASDSQNNHDSCKEKKAARKRTKKRTVRIAKTTTKDPVKPQPKRSQYSPHPHTEEFRSLEEDSFSSDDTVQNTNVFNLSQSSAFHTVGSDSLGSPRKDPPSKVGISRSASRESVDDSVLTSATDETRTMVEVGPNCFMPLISANETAYAVERGNFCLHMCLSCGEPQYSIDTAELVICNHCRTIEPLAVGQAGGGVGMGFDESDILVILEGQS